MYTLSIPFIIPLETKQEIYNQNQWINMYYCFLYPVSTYAHISHHTYYMCWLGNVLLISKAWITIHYASSIIIMRIYSYIILHVRLRFIITMWKMKIYCNLCTVYRFCITFTSKNGWFYFVISERKVKNKITSKMEIKTAFFQFFWSCWGWISFLYVS